MPIRKDVVTFDALHGVIPEVQRQRAFSRITETVTSAIQLEMGHQLAASAKPRPRRLRARQQSPFHHAAIPSFART
jgi:hypothetical protein